jgi:Tripartite tricarboxylate transporter TctB family
MKSALLSNKDFLAGLLFAVIGCVAIVVARNYPFGTTMRMGAGYFPTVLGALLILLGGWVAARGLRSRLQVEGAWGWKPLGLVVLAIVLFGIVMPRFGLIPALVVLVFVSALAGPEFRFTEVLALSVIVSALAAVLLLYVLKLPYPLIGELRWIS